MKKWTAGAVAAATLGAVLTMTGVAVSASAATTGPGYEGITPWGGALVQYLANGDMGPCADSQSSWPSGATGPWTTATSFTTESGDVLAGAALAQLNAGHSAYKSGVFGDPSNNDVAAADAAFQYAYTSSQAHQKGISLAAGMVYVNGKQSVASKLTDIWNYAQANWNQGGNGSTGGTIEFHVDPSNNYIGTLSVSLNNPEAGGTVTLTNGRFDSTGSADASVRNGDVLAVHGVAPDDAATYKITAHGSFTAPGGVKAEIKVAVTPGKQRIVTGTGASNPVSFTLDAEDPSQRSAYFQPIATSSVPAVFTNKGESFKDTYTFSTTSDSAGLNNPWRTYSDGHYTVVSGTVTVYGPFTTDPALNPQPTVPAGSPVAAKGRIETSPDSGPTITYPFDSGVMATESGYYTSVITLDAREMNAEAQATIPAGYTYAESFGETAQTQIVPSTITFSTKLDKTQVTIGQTVIDAITPQLAGGAWLVKDGARVPLPLVQTVYYSAEPITQSPAVPSNAEAIGTYHAVFTGPSSVEGESLSVGYRSGFITVVTCIDIDAIPLEQRGLINTDNPCDGYGIPAETATVNAVRVHTQAQVDESGWTIRDLVTSTGPGRVEDLVKGLDVRVDAYYIAPGAEHVCEPSNRVDMGQTVLSVHLDESDASAITGGFNVSGDPQIRTDDSGNPLGGIQFVEKLSTVSSSDETIELPVNPDACNVATEYVELGKPPVAPTPSLAPLAPKLATTGKSINALVVPGAVAAYLLAAGLFTISLSLYRRYRLG